MKDRTKKYLAIRKMTKAISQIAGKQRAFNIAMQHANNGMQWLIGMINLTHNK